MRSFTNKQFLLAAFMVIIMAGLGSTLVILQKQQDLRSRAEKTTVLSFVQTATSNTSSIQTTTGNKVSVDLIINPGNNLVSFVKAELDYDPTKLAITNTASFQPNLNAFSQIVEGPVFLQGQMVTALTIGANPAKAITQPTKIGTVTFNVIDATGANGTTISYGPNSQVLAIGANANLNENVIANKANITILANGQPPVQVCGNSQTDTMVIIDRSGSMNDKVGTTGTKISNAKTSADNFVDILATDTKNQLGLVTYSTTSKLNSSLTNSFSTVKSQIDAVTVSGNTCIQCAIDQTNQELIAHGRSGIKKVAVLLTDGIANTVEGSSGQVSPAQAEQKALDALKSSFAQTGVVYYTIGLGKDVNAAFLKQVADLTGGKYYLSPTTDQLQDIYRQISQILAKGSVSGMVFNDLNNNGSYDAEEPALTGWIMQLFSNGSSIPTNFTSDSTGTFNFTGLCDGTYTLQELQQPGWNQTKPANLTGYAINISGGKSTTDNDFGNYSVPTPTNTPVPTSTPIPSAAPTVTPVPSGPSTQLMLNIYLHGIGASGDNANQTAYTLSNKHPLHPVRLASISLYDASNQLAASATADVTYSSESGRFAGTFSITTPITSGSYMVKVGMDQHLTRLLPGIQTISLGQNNNLPDATLVTGDINNDNKLNILDYNTLIDCYSDLAPPVNCSDPAKKTSADINDDGDVNQFDYNLFLREISTQPGE